MRRWWLETELGIETGLGELSLAAGVEPTGSRDLGGRVGGADPGGGGMSFVCWEGHGEEEMWGVRRLRRMEFVERKN